MELRNEIKINDVLPQNLSGAKKKKKTLNMCDVIGYSLETEVPAIF